MSAFLHSNKRPKKIKYNPAAYQSESILIIVIYKMTTNINRVWRKMDAFSIKKHKIRSLNYLRLLKVYEYKVVSRRS